MVGNPYEYGVPGARHAVMNGDRVERAREGARGMKHVLVIANETVAGQTLIEALKERAAAEQTRVTVIAPINAPREGYVVYEDTRRASAGRRLDRTLRLLREAGIPASGLVVDTDPVNATRDAIAQAEPPIDSVVVSTHPEERSGWLQRNVVERVQKAAGDIPVEHVVVDIKAEGGPMRTCSWSRTRRSSASRCSSGSASVRSARRRAS